MAKLPFRIKAFNQFNSYNPQHAKPKHTRRESAIWVLTEAAEPLQTFTEVTVTSGQRETLHLAVTGPLHQPTPGVAVVTSRVAEDVEGVEQHCGSNVMHSCFCVYVMHSHSYENTELKFGMSESVTFSLLYATGFGSG